MATLFEQLATGLDSNAFNVALSGEVGRLGEIANQSATLRDNPAGVAGFTSALAGLPTGNLPDGRDVTARLASARGALPAVTQNAAPAALDDLGRFGTLIAERLVPVLSRSIEAAKAIEALGSVEFTCPPEPSQPGDPAPPANQTPPTGQSRAQAARDQAQAVSNQIAALPSPLTPGSLLDYAVDLTNKDVRARIFPMALPLIDDVLRPLQTLGRWSAQSPAEVGGDLANSLTMLRDRLRAPAAALDARITAANGLRAPMQVAGLQTFLTDYTAAATACADALDADDAGTAATRAGTMSTAIAAFIAVRDAHAATFTALVPSAAKALEGEPDLLFDELLHLSILLETLNTGAFLTGARPPAPTDSAAAQELQEFLSPMVNFVEDLTEKLDLSAIEGGVADVARDAQQIANDIQGAFATVAQETRAAFDQVAQAIRDLPLEELNNQIKAGLDDLGTAIQTGIRDAFEPLRKALEEAIKLIADAVDQLDPEAVKATLADVVQQLTAVLRDPQVLKAVQEIRELIEKTSEVIGDLSFEPIADEVIKLIDAMTKGVKALNAAELNDALEGMLTAAMSVLPPDLRPVTKPLVDEFGVVIERGPVQLLEAIREKPQQLVDQIRAFDPAKAAGQALGGPFNEAVQALDKVKPGAMIGQLDAVLDREKARLRDQASPAKALQPVVDGFDDLLKEFDKLSPDTLLKPIEDAVEKAIQDVIAASPVDEIFAEINKVFDTILAVIDTANQIHQTLQQVAQALDALKDPDEAIDTWRDTLLDKIDNVPNAAALTTLLGEIADAIDAVRKDDLLTAYDAAIADLKGDLDTLAPEAGLAGIVALHQRVAPKVRTLVDGPNRQAIEQALAAFDPLNQNHTGGLRAAATLHRALGTCRAEIDKNGAEFADLLHGEDGTLKAIKDGAADASLLRAAVLADVEAALKPVRFLMAHLGAAAFPFGALAQAAADLHGKMTTSAGNILTGPNSLKSISDAVQQVVDTIRNIDLAFLRESLEAVFRAIRDEIEGAGPKPVVLALEKEFGEILDTISLDLVLPQQEVAALDQSAEELVAKIRAFDPEKLVGATVGPVWEQDVLPMVEALDITPIFTALIERLKEMEDDLETELGRVNTAYQKLIASRPGGSGQATASVAAG